MTLLASVTVFLSVLAPLVPSQAPVQTFLCADIKCEAPISQAHASSVHQAFEKGGLALRRLEAVDVLRKPHEGLNSRFWVVRSLVTGKVGMVPSSILREDRKLVQTSDLVVVPMEHSVPRVPPPVHSYPSQPYYRRAHPEHSESGRSESEASSENHVERTEYEKRDPSSFSEEEVDHSSSTHSSPPILEASEAPIDVRPTTAVPDADHLKPTPLPTYHSAHPPGQSPLTAETLQEGTASTEDSERTSDNEVVKRVVAEEEILVEDSTDEVTADEDGEADGEEDQSSISSSFTPLFPREETTVVDEQEGGESIMGLVGTLVSGIMDLMPVSAGGAVSSIAIDEVAVGAGEGADDEVNLVTGADQKMSESIVTSESSAVSSSDDPNGSVSESTIRPTHTILGAPSTDSSESEPRPEQEKPLESSLDHSTSTGDENTLQTSLPEAPLQQLSSNASEKIVETPITTEKIVETSGVSENVVVTSSVVDNIEKSPLVPENYEEVPEIPVNSQETLEVPLNPEQVSPFTGHSVVAETMTEVVSVSEKPVTEAPTSVTPSADERVTQQVEEGMRHRDSAFSPFNLAETLINSFPDSHGLSPGVQDLPTHLSGVSEDVLRDLRNTDTDHSLNFGSVEEVTSTETVQGDASGSLNNSRANAEDSSLDLNTADLPWETHGKTITSPGFTEDTTPDVIEETTVAPISLTEDQPSTPSSLNEDGMNPLDIDEMSGVTDASTPAEYDQEYLGTDVTIPTELPSLKFSSIPTIIRSLFQGILPEPVLDDVVIITSLVGLFLIFFWSSWLTLSWFLQRRSEISRIIKLSNQLARTDSERVCLASECEELREKINSEKKILREAGPRVSELEAQLDQSEQMYQELMTSHGALQRRVEELEQDQKKLVTSEAQLKVESGKYQEHMSEFASQVEANLVAQQDALKEKDTLIKRLKRTLQEANHAKNSLQVDIQGLKNQLDSEASVKEEVEKLRKVVGEYQTLCSQEGENGEAKLSLSQDQVEALVRYKNEVIELRQQLQDSKSEYEKKFARIEAEQEFAMAACRREKENLYEELMAKKAELKEFVEKIQTSEGLVERLREQNALVDKYKSRIQSLEQDFEQAEHDHLRALEEKETIIFDLERDRRVDRRKISSLEGETQDLRQQLTALATEQVQSKSSSVNGDLSAFLIDKNGAPLAPLELLMDSFGVPEDRLPPLGYRASSPGNSLPSRRRTPRSPSPSSWSAASSGYGRRTGYYQRAPRRPSSPDEPLVDRDEDASKRSRGKKGGGRRSSSPQRYRTPSPPRYRSRNNDPYRRSPSPRTIGAGRRYRSPSPAGGNQRYRSPSRSPVRRSRESLPHAVWGPDGGESDVMAPPLGSSRFVPSSPDDQKA